MIVLGVESSAVSAGAALLKDGKLISESYLNVGLTHSETLLRLIDTCMQNAGVAVSALDAVAVAAGPGSFTGVRIGISAVKGFVFGTDIPVFGVSTLEALAYGALYPAYYIVPVMDARCKQVYTAQFEYENNELVRRTQDNALKVEELYESLRKQNKPVLLLGDGAKLTLQLLDGKPDVRVFAAPEIFQYQHAAGVAFAAWMRYNNGERGQRGDALTPCYLRLPQAERDRNKGAKKE